MDGLCFFATASLSDCCQMKGKLAGPIVPGRRAMSPSPLDSASLGFFYSEVIWVVCIFGYGLSQLCCITTARATCWSLPGARTWVERAFLQAQTAELRILLLNVVVFTAPQCLSRSCCCLSVLWHCTWVNLLWPDPLSQPFDKVWGPGIILGGSFSFSRVSNLKLSVFFL